VTEDIPTLPLGGLAFSSQSNNWTVTGNTIELAVNAGTPVIEVRSNTANVGTALAGSQGLQKTGNGTLNLTAANNRYSGTTSVDAGNLLLSGAGSLYSGGTSSGAIVVSNGGTLTFAHDNTFGVHTGVPLPSLTVHAGGLVQNNGAFFNTLGPVALNGGELRVVGGLSAQWNAWQIRGTVTVAGVSASQITGLKTTNGFVQTAIGNNSPGGATTFEVADVTGDPAPDLLVSSGFADSRTLTGAYTAVASSFVKKGPGTALFSGNNINTGPNLLDAGTIVVSGGVFNSAVVLSNGTTLVAQEGEGLVGEYYYYTASPLANFNTYEAMGDHLAGLSANLLFNGPATGTNLDFGGGGCQLPASDAERQRRDALGGHVRRAGGRRVPL
jgi:fibronectin-binding autotransporter adhesin